MVKWDWRDDEYEMDESTVVGFRVIESATIRQIDSNIQRYLNSIPGFKESHISDELISERILRRPRLLRKNLRHLVYLRTPTEKDSRFHGFEPVGLDEYLLSSEIRREFFRLWHDEMRPCDPSSIQRD